MNHTLASTSSAPVAAVRCRAFQGTLQCSEWTYETDMCREHLEDIQGLCVKQSTLPQAGKGLFTTIDRKKGDIIGIYRGTIHRKPISGDYVISNGEVWIDACKPTDCASRFANMAVELRESPNLHASTICNNALFEDMKEITLVASSDIKAGDEVFADYGTTYFTQAEQDMVLFPIPSPRSIKKSRQERRQRQPPRKQEQEQEQEQRRAIPLVDSNILFALPAHAVA